MKESGEVSLEHKRLRGNLKSSRKVIFHAWNKRTEHLFNTYYVSNTAQILPHLA